MNVMKDAIGGALGIDAGSIAISGLKLAEAVDQGSVGRRRTQAAREVTFNIQITGPDAIVVLTTLSEQVADPNSALRTAAGVTSESLVFSFICPVGTYRPIGGSECSFCSDTSVPDSATDFRSCRECLPGQAPDRASHSRCVCADGYYNSSAGRNLLKCFADGEPWALLTASSNVDCLPCAETDCVDIDAISCEGGTVTLQTDYSVSSTSLSHRLWPSSQKLGQSRVGGGRSK